ncbi:hypothetical protein BC833DRAFT_659745 [Globomyces pollinis-pini]|nr:hypothetical protein BC833DRAFT_659745 [Globomyces pollinis-pini]
MLRMRLKALWPRAETKEEISKLMQQLYLELTDEDRKKGLGTFKDKLCAVIKSGGHTILGWKTKKKPRTSGGVISKVSSKYSDQLVEFSGTILIFGRLNISIRAMTQLQNVITMIPRIDPRPIPQALALR